MTQLCVAEHAPDSY